MNGLLGDTSDDPKTMATWNLVAGLLSPGSFGQGLSKGMAGYQATLANDQDMKFKSQQLATAQQNMALQRLQMQMALRKQAYMFGDDTSTPTPTAPATGVPPLPQLPQQPQQPSVMAGSGPVPSFMSAPNNPTMGGSAPAPMQPTAPASPPAGIDPRFNLPTSLVRADMILNDGKNIATFMHDANKPVSLRPGGYAAYSDGRVEQMPQVPEGFQAIKGADGQWHVVPVDGGPTALGISSTAKASGPAAFKQTEVIGPDGSKYTTFNKDLPGFGVPGVPAPTSPVAPPPKPVSGNYVVPPAVQASRDAEALKIAQNELLRTPAGPDRDQLVATIKRIQSGGTPIPPGFGTTPMNLTPSNAPPTGVRTGFAPGVVAGADAGATNAQGTMTNSYKSVMAANQPAQTVQARLDNIASLAQKAITGGNTEWRDYANNLAQIAGISDRAMDRKTAGDLIDKNAAQISLAIGSGTQGTDALRALASAANPNRSMTPDAINEAVSQLKASAAVQQAKASLLTPLYNSQKPADYNTAEQAFDKNADYRLFQIKQATQGMNAQQIADYFHSKGYTPAQVATFQQQRAALKNLGVDL